MNDSPLLSETDKYINCQFVAIPASSYKGVGAMDRFLDVFGEIVVALYLFAWVFLPDIYGFKGGRLHELPAKSQSLHNINLVTLIFQVTSLYIGFV